MTKSEIVDQQISLLANLNEQLVAQGTPEAMKEIRENALAIAELIKLSPNMEQEVQQLMLRLGCVEDILYGRMSQEEGKEYYEQDRRFFSPVIMTVRDHDDYIDVIHDWMEKIENHLELEEGWDDEAGD